MKKLKEILTGLAVVVLCDAVFLLMCIVILPH